MCAGAVHMHHTGISMRQSMVFSVFLLLVEPCMLLINGSCCVRPCIAGVASEAWCQLQHCYIYSCHGSLQSLVVFESRCCVWVFAVKRRPPCVLSTQHWRSVATVDARCVQLLVPCFLLVCGNLCPMHTRSWLRDEVHGNWLHLLCRSEACCQLGVFFRIESWRRARPCHQRSVCMA